VSERELLELQRLTTEYVDAEDRMRLTGEIRPGETLVLWLSQRLLMRLLPHLFLWLEKQGSTPFPVEIEQSFEQQAALANLSLEAPVQRTRDSKAWMVEAVDMTAGDHALRLSFRRQGEETVSLTMPALAMRQWLTIIRSLWGMAEWHEGLWPEWVQSVTAKAVATGRQLH
jgi:hypothetical protein